MAVGEGLVSLRTEPFAAERAWEAEGVPVLWASAEVPEPVPAEDRASRRIRRFYRLQCRAFLRYCERCLLPQAAAQLRLGVGVPRRPGGQPAPARLPGGAAVSGHL